LEEAQQSFGWSPDTFVPVIYTNPDISLLDELFKFLPTLLVIGALIWTTRSTLRSFGSAGGFGSRGGRSIFNVGKAQVCLIYRLFVLPRRAFALETGVQSAVYFLQAARGHGQFGDRF
jgi:hypothetical protein